MRDYTNNLSKIKGAEMWKILREHYLQKREAESHGKYPTKKSFQIFNEALVETLSVETVSKSIFNFIPEYLVKSIYEDLF